MAETGGDSMMTAVFREASFGSGGSCCGGARLARACGRVAESGRFGCSSRLAVPVEVTISVRVKEVGW